MNTLLPDDFRLETKTPFKVVIAYDDVAMGVRAKHVFDSVARTMEPDCTPVLNIWKFSMLQMPELADSAVIEAAAANMIILALHEDNGVPQEARTWIENWLALRARAEGALVLLFDPAKNPSTAVMHTDFYLLDAGLRGNLDVFSHTDTDNYDNLDWLCVECNRLHVASRPQHPLADNPSDRMGKAGQNRTPIHVVISAPGVTRSIQVG